MTVIHPTMSNTGHSSADVERWRRVEAICQRALELDGQTRTEYVSAAVGDDARLRSEVEALLAHTGNAQGFLSTPALAVAAESLAAPAIDLVGRTIGDYEIASPLGAGGMGIVYRAHDRKLGRDVALKLLPPELAADAERLSRFRREAKLLATLSHPHIGSIFGFVEDGATCALVLELIEGETVDSLLVRGPLRLPQALTIAMQVAEALDHVHRRGITHRDLKPSNIMVTKTGARLLDFGIGKWSAAGGIDRPGGFTTETKDGALVGTLNYMAPEQLEGRDVGPRTDLFALGAVLYEMLTGRRAFAGPSRATIMAAIMHEEPPPLSAVVGMDMPARLDRVIAKCLAKDPDQRWQTARDLADALKWSLDELSVKPAAQRRAYAGARPLQLAAVVAAIALAVLATSTWLVRRESPAGAALPPPVRFTVTPPIDVPISAFDFDISHDGRMVAYRGRSGPTFIRRIDAFETVTLPSQLRIALALSPDSQSVAFFSSGSLYRVALRGDTPPVLLTTTRENGLALDWPTRDALFFSARQNPIMRVPADGGPPVAVTRVETPREVDHHAPRLLPEGKALLFSIHRQRNRFAVAAQRLDSGERSVLLEDAFDASYLSTGHLVFGRGSALLAAAFDLGALQITGPPITVLEGVASDPRSGATAYEVSADGALLYHAAVTAPARTFVWVDRRGHETVVPIAPGDFEAPRVSPDGKRIAFGRYEPRSRLRRIWLYDVGTEALTPVTLEGDNWGPVWTRDGSALAYGTDRTEASHVLLHAIDGKAPTSLGASVNDLWPAGFAEDGSAILVEVPPTDEFFVSRLEPGGQPKPVITGRGFPSDARVSPDGRWIAYEAVGDTRAQVFVQPASGSGPGRQLSIDGGRSPVWSRDGQELFFLRDRQMVAVSFQAAGIAPSKPVVLFEGDYVTTSGSYDVAPDGRFLMMKSAVQRTVPQLHVVLNWVTELVARVPISR